MGGVGARCALLLVVACGYPEPEPAVVGIGPGEGDGDGGIIFNDFDAAEPDGPEPDAVPIDAPPDAPPGYFGTAPTAGTASFSGTTDVGKVLTASAAGFDLGSPAAGYHYIWQRCTSSACTSVTTIGTDSSTYALTSTDAGSASALKYIRVGVYAENACASGCGASNTVYSSAKGPVRRVDLVKGASCTAGGGCTSSACKIMHISLVGFSGSSHTGTCNASNVTNNPWLTYTTTTWPSDRCCYGFAGKTVWATVDGLRSPNITNW